VVGGGASLQLINPSNPTPPTLKPPTQSISCLTSNLTTPPPATHAALFSGALAPRYRRPLAAGLSLMVLQQVTGQPSVLYYAATIFKAAGFDTSGEAAAVSVVGAGFRVGGPACWVLGVWVLGCSGWGPRPSPWLHTERVEFRTLKP
jgi:hypothetical protein